MEKVLRLVLTLLPLIFAFGFLVPLIMQGMDRMGWAAPFGLPALIFALIIGGGWGLTAQIRGRWI